MNNTRAAQVIDLSLEKPMPHSLESERATIGAILLDAKAIYPASEILKADDFYLEGHRKIFSRMLAMITDEKAIDYFTLKEELQRHSEIEAAGGPAYLSGLTEGLPRGMNVGQYAQTVREKSSLRRLIQSANELMARAYQAEESPSQILEEHESQIFQVAAREVKGGFRSSDDLVTAAYRELEETSNRKTLVTGIETGFTELDKMSGGLQDEDLIIVAARPGLGKTSLALNIACHAGIRKGRVVGVFSLEMGAVQLAKMRMLASEAEVDAHKLRSGYLNKEDWIRLGRSAGAISQSKIYVDDGNNSMTQIRAKANRLAMEHGVDLIIIDYLQLMAGSERRQESRTQEVGAISRSCKQLARELHVPVIALSQLNRNVEHGGRRRRPQLSDLRESGAIEQDADLVLFIHREETINPTEENHGIAEIIVGKHRNGPTGEFQLAWLNNFCKFANLWQETEQRQLYN